MKENVSVKKSDPKNIEKQIRRLADKYAKNLKSKIDERVEGMKSDNLSHYLIYQVLGITAKEGELIDLYQNKGRFLYKYAGSFLEEVTILCFENKFSNAQRKVRIPNNTGRRPKTFEIDCLVGKDAYEIKWRDATTDGDHITKEHTKLQNIKKQGYHPIRIMFYYPNRDQAIRIQEALRTMYIGMGGKYYYSEKAWRYVKTKTGIDLLKILKRHARKKTKENPKDL